MSSRSDGRGREIPEGMDATNRGGPLRRGERTGSPGPITMKEHAATSSWQDTKSRFVDDPAGAIAAAEELVYLAVEQRVRALKDEAAAGCALSHDEDASSTETMRTRLLRCQEYCERLARTSMH